MKKNLCFLLNQNKLKLSIKLMILLLVLVGGLIYHTQSVSSIADPLPNEINWTGQGTDSQDCNKMHESEERTASGWIHWILTQAGSVTDANLLLSGTGSGTYLVNKQAGGSLHFFSPFFDLNGLNAKIKYNGSLGENPQFTISDYCPGDSITPTPDPTSTPQPDPTSTPQPDPTSTPTPEVTIAVSPTPTSTPTPEPTPKPTSTPALTSTPTPKPTSTPAPTATSTPQPASETTSVEETQVVESETIREGQVLGVDTQVLAATGTFSNNLELGLRGVFGFILGFTPCYKLSHKQKKIKKH